MKSLLSASTGAAVQPLPLEYRRCGTFPAYCCHYKEQNFPEAQPQNWVLPGLRSRPMELSWLMEKYIGPLATKLGIPQIHWHALRHMNNSMMLDAGVDVKTRMDRLGHVSDRVNMIYAHAGTRPKGRPARRSGTD